MNVDELIATAQHRTEVVRICARGDLVARHAEAVHALGDATHADDSLAGSPEITSAAGEVVSIEAEMEAATVEFTIGSVSRKRWADLLAKHPPSKEQRRAGLDHDPVTFPVAAIAACCKDPEMTVEQSERLADVLPPGEWVKLWSAAFRLNITETPFPKSAAATEFLQVNGHSSTTSLPEASPEEGSLAGSGEQ